MKYFLPLLALIQELEANLYARSTGHPLSQACTGKNVVNLSDRLDMTIDVDWDVKPQTKHIFQTKKY